MLRARVLLGLLVLLPLAAACARTEPHATSATPAATATATATATSTPTSTSAATSAASPIASVSAPPAPTATDDGQPAGMPCIGPVDGTRKDNPCHDRKTWRSKMNWGDECEGSYQGLGIEFHYLEQGRYLVQVICSLGAYQGSSVFYFWEQPPKGPGRALPVTFPVPNNGPGPRILDQREISNFADFDPKKNELKVWTRYRGPGDCGSLVRYGFAGTKVAVREMRHQPECNGKETTPERWPLMNPSRR